DTSSLQFGQLTGSGPSFDYTPYQDSYGTDTFGYTATDAGGLSVTTTVTINVTFVNQAPRPQDQAFATDDDTPVGIIFNVYDPEGDPITFSIVTPPAHGTLTGTAPKLIYTPTTPGSYVDSFVYRAADPSAASATATVTLTMTAHAPQQTRAEFEPSNDPNLSYPSVAMDASGNFVAI